ncbi:hypothetical protein N9N67_07270 [Bacteriovoracaceae bacterium]|nr:hypothetical protein [Bacteriovoracaceae bacterium]
MRSIYYLLIFIVSNLAHAECLKTYTQEDFDKVKNYDEFFLCNFNKYGSFVHLLAGNIMATKSLLKNCSRYKNQAQYFVTKLKIPSNCQKMHVSKLTPGNKINLNENKKDCLKAAKYLTENLINQKFNTVVFSQNLAVCFPRELEASAYCCESKEKI